MQAANSAPKTPPQGFFYFWKSEMAGAKTISLIAEEMKKVRAAEQLDVEAILATIDHENQKIVRLIKALEERVDLLEHQ